MRHHQKRAARLFVEGFFNQSDVIDKNNSLQAEISNLHSIINKQCKVKLFRLGSEEMEPPKCKKRKIDLTCEIGKRGRIKFPKTTNDDDVVFLYKTKNSKESF